MFGSSPYCRYSLKIFSMLCSSLCWMCSTRMCFRRSVNLIVSAPFLWPLKYVRYDTHSLTGASHTWPPNSSTFRTRWPLLNLLLLTYNSPTMPTIGFVASFLSTERNRLRAPLGSPVFHHYHFRSRLKNRRLLPVHLVRLTLIPLVRTDFMKHLCEKVNTHNSFPTLS